MRITKHMKDKLIAHALSQHYKERLKLVYVKTEELLEKAYNVLYPLEIQVKMKQLPDEFFMCVSEFKFESGGRTHRLSTANPKRMGALHYWSASLGEVFYEEANAIRYEMDSIRNEKASKKYEMQNALYPINTRKQLIEAWPEAETLLEELGFIDNAAIKKNLPAKQYPKIQDILTGPVQNG